MPELVAAPCAHPSLPHRFLSPGGLFVLTRPCEVTTILGPCVAATFWCSHSHVAVICHAMLPTSRAGDTAPPGPTSWKYVDEVIPKMLERFTQKGGQVAALEVKLFGGAELLRDCGGSLSNRIGPQNVALARKLIEALGFSVIAADVGGNTGRKLIFNTQTGRVRIKRLPNSARPHS